MIKMSLRGDRMHIEHTDPEDDAADERRERDAEDAAPVTVTVEAPSIGSPMYAVVARKTHGGRTYRVDLPRSADQGSDLPTYREACEEARERAARYRTAHPRTRVTLDV